MSGDLPEAYSAPPLRSRSSDRRLVDVEHLVVRCALRVIGCVLVVLVLVLLAWRLRALLLLLAVALFIAAVLNPFVAYLCRRGVRRTAAVLIVYLTLVVLGLGLGYVLFHPVYDSAVRLAHDLPGLVRSAQSGNSWLAKLARRYHLLSYVQSHVPTLERAVTSFGKPALAVGKTVLSGVVSVITIAFVSLFVLLEAPGVVRNLLGFMSDEHAVIARRVSGKVTRQVTGFMLGDFATSVIAGIVVFVTLEVTGVPFATVLAIWLGLVDFLPLVGGLIGAVPAIGVAFLHSVSAGVVTAVVFLIYQQVENHFLNPMIISRTVRLNPLWVLVAVLFGAEIGNLVGSTFGAICGAIFAVPTAGAIQVATGEVNAHRRARTNSAGPSE